MTGSLRPSLALAERVAELAGRRPTGWFRATQGYTPAERWSVRFDDGSSAFVKAAVNDETGGWLRTEHELYKHLSGAPFVARLEGWDDDGERPLLMLEDLSAAQWPPPWTTQRIHAVLATLDAIHATAPPAGAMSLDSLRDDLAGWARVEEEPASFLALGDCTAAWLNAALPTLVEAESAARLEGDELLHFDVRSDNLCFPEGRTVFVDWNSAIRGNGRLDAVSWMPSLRLEGGPPPESLIAPEPELAALIAGYFAHRARLPEIPLAPRVRTIQRAQLRVALPWVAGLLGLPPPGRPGRLS
jgi:hypothetical protein